MQYIYQFYRNLIRNKNTRWLTILATIVYILSPVDLLPEVLLPFVGLVDDLAIMLILGSEILMLLITKDSSSDSQKNSSDFKPKA